MCHANLDFDVELDRERFVQLGEDGTIDHLYEKALEYYHTKRDGLAGPFPRSIRRIVDEAEDGKHPERIVVDFTDGQRVLRAVTRTADVVESEGEEVNDALERAAVLSFIDERWTEHLRKLDELREIARELDLPDYGDLRKQDLIYRILEAQAEGAATGESPPLEDGPEARGRPL